VPKEVLSKLIDLAHYAPTAGNRQKVEWIVISGRDYVKSYAKLAVDCMRESLLKNTKVGRQNQYDSIVYAWDMGLDVVCRNAPHLIVAHAEYEESIISQFNTADCATALAYMELAAPSLGLGTYWNGIFLYAVNNWQPLQDALSIPKQNRCYGVLMAGYPRFKYYRMPTRRPPMIRWKKNVEVSLSLYPDTQIQSCADRP